MFAQAAFAGLQAATQNAALTVGTLQALRQQSIGLDNRLNLSALYHTDENGNRVARQLGNLEVFGGFEVGSYEVDAGQINPGGTGDTQVFKVGADVAIAPGVALGAGISIDRGEVDFNGNRGGFDSKLYTGAIFGVAEVAKGIYVNGVVGYGEIDVHDINRSFALGPTTESYDASTDGSYLVASVGTGAMIPVFSGLVLNPNAKITYERVKIDGYDEEFGAASLSYGSSEIDSERLSLGLAAFYRPAVASEWVFSLRGSLEYELNDDDVEVTFGPDQQRLSTLSSARPDGSFGYISGSINREIGKAGTLSLNASTVVGLEDTSGYTVGVTYKHSF